MSSITIGLRDFKSHLSAYVRRVKAGETLVITERGKPVGRLIPVESSCEEALRRLESVGALAWSGRKFGGSTSSAPTVRGGRTVSELLLEDRH